MTDRKQSIMVLVSRCPWSSHNGLLAARPTN